MYEEQVKLIVKVLLIAGAINWGSISLIGVDIVSKVFGYGNIDKFIKLLVGIAGGVASYDLFMTITAKPVY